MSIGLRKTNSTMSSCQRICKMPSSTGTGTIHRLLTAAGERIIPAIGRQAWLCYPALTPAITMNETLDFLAWLKYGAVKEWLQAPPSKHLLPPPAEQHPHATTKNNLHRSTALQSEPASVIRAHSAAVCVDLLFSASQLLPHLPEGCRTCGRGRCRVGSAALAETPGGTGMPPAPAAHLAHAGARPQRHPLSAPAHRGSF